MNNENKLLKCPFIRTCTPLEIKSLLKKLDVEYVDNNGSRIDEHPKPPRSKI